MIRNKKEFRNRDGCGTSFLFHAIKHKKADHKARLSVYLMYSEKSVSLMSPLRASVSCMAKAAVRQ